MKKQLLTATILLTTNVLLHTTASAQVIAAGATHSLALCSDSTVRSWGQQTSGSLGTYTAGDHNTPVQVHGTGNVGFLTGVVAIAAGGGGQSRALKSDGSVWDWGGHTGNGSGLDQPTPVQALVSGITNISCGNYHTIARKNDGTVWTWGSNNRGALGDGTVTDSDTPLQVPGLTNVIAVAGGGYHSLAVKNDGTVWAWGENYYGELGDGTTNTTGCWCNPSPVQVTGLTGVIAVAGTGTEASLALKSDGTVWGWGADYSGQLGDGNPGVHPSPVQASGLTGVTSIACGFRGCIALKNDGTVWGWGVNGYGAVGDGTTIERHTPTQAVGLSGIVAIAAAGGDHCLALRNDGTVLSWGYNYFGQLGEGTNGSAFGCGCDSLAGPVSGQCSMAAAVSGINLHTSLAVYPNPTSGTFTIDDQNTSGMKNIEVRNAVGQEVLRSTFNGARSEIDLSSQPSGVYFLSIRTAGQVISRELIKE